MKAVLKRVYSNRETFGSLIATDDKGVKIFECKTLELPNIGNERKISCIPEGTYEVHRVISPSKGKCFSVENVPGRSSILIHKGNFATGVKVDTLGCILVGSKFSDANADGFLDVVESTITLDKMLKLFPVKFELIIKEDGVQD